MTEQEAGDAHNGSGGVQETDKANELNNGGPPEKNRLSRFYSFVPRWWPIIIAHLLTIVIGLMVVFVPPSFQESAILLDHKISRYRESRTEIAAIMMEYDLARPCLERFHFQKRAPSGCGTKVDTVVELRTLIARTNTIRVLHEVDPNIEHLLTEIGVLKHRRVEDSIQAHLKSFERDLANMVRCLTSNDGKDRPLCVVKISNDTLKLALKAAGEGNAFDLRNQFFIWFSS
ncbi:MAG: hypothetical protein AAF423_01280 [Pseudomonadota bacterium]